MKKLMKLFNDIRIVFMVMILLLTLIITGNSYAEECKQTTTKTADSAAVTVPGFLCGIMVVTDGTNSVTVTGTDSSTSASGVSMFPAWVVTTSASNRAQTLTFENVLRFSNGVYIDITTAGTVSYMVYWKNR